MQHSSLFGGTVTNKVTRFYCDNATLDYSEYSSCGGSVIIKVTGFDYHSAFDVAMHHSAIVSSTVVMKLTHFFYSNIAFSGIQYSSNSCCMVITKITSFYHDVARGRTHSTSRCSSVVVYEYIFTHVNNAFLLCKYSSTIVCSVAFKLALTNANCAISGDYCSSNLYNT